MTRWMPWMLVLIGAFVMGGCDGGADDDDTVDDDDTADDDDDDTVDDDDTTDDDDDDTGGEPSLTLDQTEFYAGDWAWIGMQTANYVIDDTTTMTWDEDAMDFGGTQNVTEDALDAFWMFSLLADGTYSIGLDGDAGAVSADVQVTAITIDEMEEGAPAVSGVAGGDYAFDAFHYDEPVGGRYLTITPTNLGTSFEPYLWATWDGLTFMAQNWDPVTDDMGSFLSIYLFEAGDVYLRVGARDGANDTAQTFDLDVVATPVSATLNEIEVESNDDPANPQDVGMVAPESRLIIEGDSASTGHDADGIWNADLDFFAFEVSQDCYMNVQLDWPDGADDYDLLIYDVSSQDPDLTDYDHLVGWYYAASLNYPERTAGVLHAGTPYVIFVGGWDGDPGTYEVTLALSPML